MASVRKIAKEVGVSVATVSRALNDHPEVNIETKQKVIDVANRLGYVPAMSRTPANVVGLVYPSDPVRTSFGDFESAMLSGILQGINEQSFDVTIVNLARDKQPGESYTRFFRRKGVRGVILRALASGSLAEEIVAEGFPCIIVADRSTQAGVNYVCGDSRLDSVKAVEHLIYQGHKRIALGAHTVMDTDHRDREAGYLEALDKHNIAIDRDLVVPLPSSPEGGSETIDRVLGLDDPATAIYITTPLSTIGALHRCLELGVHVPQEFSIVGFDDSDVRKRTFPPYTAVCQNAEQLGVEAARWLTRALNGNAVGSFQVRHPTRFEINGSTGMRPKHPIRLRPDGMVIRGR
ncbi:MAG: LacI family DNA-binding transcriptional regulator [Phycisphaeraceae bacterium]|nr:MAG: LacI family DNA-binding transcriptional regulator [Phycisphaeraceae bacterium]